LIFIYGKNAIVYNKHKKKERKNSVFVCSSMKHENEAMIYTTRQNDKTYTYKKKI